MARRPRHRRTSESAPRGLTATRWEQDGASMVLFSFPLPRRGGEALSAAEVAIVGALLRGDSNAEIARERGRSIRTVEHQVAAIFRKLRVRSRAELVARWSIYLRGASDL